MKNNMNSSVNITEDLVTNIMHLVASEYHLSILLRKYEDQLKYWYNDGEDMNYQSQEDQNAVLDLDKKIFDTEQVLKQATSFRRNAMAMLKEQATSEGNPDMWCLLKHTLCATITAFEVYQVKFDEASKQLFLDQSRVTNQVLAMFLGYEVTPCSACLTDQMNVELDKEEEYDLDEIDVDSSVPIRSGTSNLVPKGGEA